jgi:predicted metal-dependent phosphoesterase TrpH
MEIIDLHSHTTASDGKNTPTENVRIAVKKGLRALAITDHDTTGGIEEALKAAKEVKLEVIPGIEISTLAKGQDIHVLGYWIDFRNKQFTTELERLRETRNTRNQMMIERLNELGIKITEEEVYAKQTTPNGNVGRPHIAEVLIDKGIVGSLEQAFEEYLGREGKAYVNPPRISPEKGVQFILKYDGVPVLAHPGLYDNDELIEELVQVGLKGLEVYHPDHSTAEVEKYKRMAKEFNLVATGGSDYHGKRNGVIFHSDLGSQPVSVEVLNQLKELKKS